MKKLFFIIVVALMGIATNVSAQLPAVTLKTMEGKTVRTDTLSNNGKPIIIDFFATWCKPCNRELTAISEVYDEWVEETGVKLIAVSIDEAQNINKVKFMLGDADFSKIPFYIQPIASKLAKYVLPEIEPRFSVVEYKNRRLLLVERQLPEVEARIRQVVLE